MKSKIINILVFAGWFIIWSIFLIKVLWVSFLLIISIIVSSILIYLLSKSKNILSIYSIIIIITFNIILLIFSIIPVYNKDVNVTGYYYQNPNIMRIDIKDSDDILSENMAKIVIQNPNFFDKKFDLITAPKENIILNSWDTITFVSKSNQLQSIVNIYLWDGSIIRLLPQSTIKIDKILRDSNDILNSKTQVTLQKWNIWFRIIRTIFTKDWFNVKTSNWNIVIRWTAWLVNQDDWKTLVYSNDHIIQVENNSWDSEMVNKSEIAEMSELWIKKWTINDYIDNIWVNIVSKIKSFEEFDKKDLEEYQKWVIDYANTNFSWIFDKQKNLSYLSEIKLKFLSMIDSKYEKNYDNYNKYKYINWEDSKIWTWNEDLIITPLSNDYMNKKLEYLRNKWKNSMEATESYIINSYNKLIDEWKNISFDKNNFERIIKDVKSWDYQNKIENFYNSLMK